MQASSKVEHFFVLWKEVQFGGKWGSRKGSDFYKLRHRLQLHQVHHELHHYVLLQQQKQQTLWQAVVAAASSP